MIIEVPVTADYMINKKSTSIQTKSTHNSVGMHDQLHNKITGKATTCNA